MRLDSFFLGALCVLSGGRLPEALFMVFYWIPKVQFLFILAEQSVCCTIGEHASHHRHIFFDSVQPLLALSAQRALCTFFSLLLSASLLRCGLMVSSPEP